MKIEILETERQSLPVKEKKNSISYSKKNTKKATRSHSLPAERDS